ncbi:hypothetical protein ACE6H2_006247 [Prunus campanulata]
MQALCRLRHPITFGTLVPKLTFGTPVPKHIALQHVSFVSPSAPPCLSKLPCNMQALCRLRHPFPFGTPVPKHIALQHANFVSHSASLCLGTPLCDMQALHP